MVSFFSDLRLFLRLWGIYISRVLSRGFFRFETIKGVFAQTLYKQRGKFARPFVHSGMVAISAMGIMLAPVVSEQLPGIDNTLNAISPSSVLSAATEDPQTQTIVTDRQIDIVEYTVQDGDTVSSVAKKFGREESTITWENDLTKKSIIKPGQILRILPEDGVSHKVEKGETIYSIAKKHSGDPQTIVDFPGNTFVNDETFSLAVGQVLTIPGGVPAAEAPSRSAFARKTPDAGTVVASGNFVWPAAGNISQGFAWYHQGVDIANRAAPEVLAADSGTVIATGWDSSGYGNKVVIDHGNGFVTLYAHLQKIYVVSGQRVARGNAVGQMGSTGRSTGTHLHFEIRTGGGFKNPLDFLR